MDEPLARAERHPHYVILAERHALCSAARVSWVELEHVGQVYKMYSLGDVFTYPAFRNRGYGHQVVATATQLIRNDDKADAALLFTEPILERFYGRSGWEHIAGFSGTLGEVDQPEPVHSFAMMLFLSEKAKRERKSFEQQFVHLPGYGW